MPTVTLDEFQAGLDVSKEATRIAVGAAVTADNVRVGTGTIKSREGRVVHDALPVAAAGRALAQWYDASASPSCRLVTAVGQTLVATDEANQTFSAGVTNIVTDLHATNRPRMAAFDYNGDPWVYWVDGSAAVKRWKPGSTVTLTDLQRPSVLPLVSSSTLDGTMVTPNAPLDGGRNVGAASPADWANLNEWNAWTYGTVDGAELLGVGARKITDTTFADTGTGGRGKNESVALEFVCEASAPEWLTTGGYMVYGVPARTIGAGRESNGYDLSQASTISIRLRVVANARFSTAFPSGARLYFGRTFTPGDTTLDQYATLDLSGIALNEWVTVEADISAIAGNDKDDVRYFMLRFDAIECTPTAAAGIPQQASRAYGVGNAAVLVMVNDIWADVGDSQFVSGTYEFTYNYVWDAGTVDEEEGPAAFDATDLKNPYTSVVVDATQALGLNIYVTADAASGAAYDAVHVYARGGISADWRRIVSVSVTPGTDTSGTWDGTYPADAPVLDQYTEKPPAGCALLYAHGGRMFYAKGDTLYISNDSDADHVPISALLRMSQADGGFVPVGQDGADISGLGALGSYLLVFKPRGVWLLSGSSASDFALLPLSVETGCASHESIAQVGNRIVWLDGDGRVMGWDGQAVQEVGLPVRASIRANSTAAQRAAAMSVVDSANDAYHLVIPATTTATATPASIRYTLDLRTFTWTAGSAVPGGAYLWAQNATTPGVYALDRNAGTSPSAMPALFRMETGTSDCNAAGTAANITGTWKSGRMTLAKPRHEQDVQRLTIRFADDTVLTGVTATLYANGKATASASKALTVHQVANTGVYAEWDLPRVPNVRDFQVALSWAVQTAVEVLSVTIEADDAGEVVL